MELVLCVGGVLLSFVDPTAPPADFPNSRRWLTNVSGLNLSARAGAFQLAGATENATISVELDNRERQASELIGQPLRARAWAYEDDGRLYFDGTVQSINYGTSLSMSVEA